jgi:hypothetical protein
MAQREPTPIQQGVEIVSSDAAPVARDPLSRAVQRPHVPTRAQLMGERQATAMVFQTERSKLAITKTMEVHEHTTAEATASLLYSKHVERGFAEDELTEDERHFYAVMREMILKDSVAISAEAAQRLRAMARDLELPSTDVSDLAVIIRWLQTH